MRTAPPQGFGARDLLITNVPPVLSASQVNCVFSEEARRQKKRNEPEVGPTPNARCRLVSDNGALADQAIRGRRLARPALARVSCRVKPFGAIFFEVGALGERLGSGVDRQHGGNYFPLHSNGLRPYGQPFYLYNSSVV